MQKLTVVTASATTVMTRCGVVLSEDIEKRFWAKVQVGQTSECWLWSGPCTPQGYGRYWAGKNKVYPHRLAYELLVGPIPEGLTIDHLCRNPRCVNPAHLEPVTPRENTLRGYGLAALHAAKTHCLRGHPFDEENTRVYRGGRHCRKCCALRQRARTRHARC